MANNYTQATITPEIEITDITPLEMQLLCACGIDHYTTGKGYYFVVEEGFVSEADLWGVQIHEDHLKDNSAIAKRLNDFITNEPDGVDEILFGGDDTVAKWMEYQFKEGAPVVEAGEILQQIIQRNPDKYPEIILEGAFGCSKMRSGEFGGFIMRVTKDDVQEGGTFCILEKMRAGKW